MKLSFQWTSLLIAAAAFSSDSQAFVPLKTIPTGINVPRNTLAPPRERLSAILYSSSRGASKESKNDAPLSWWKQAVSSAVVATAVLTTPLEVELTTATYQATSGNGVIPTQQLHIRKSQALALTEEQLLVTDVWKEVTRQYLDTTYNGMGDEKWKAKRLEAVKKVTNFGPGEEEKVYEAIRTMLSSLDDPYTRFLTPDQYDALATYARGDSAGVGVQLSVEPKSGQVVVLNTVPGGPAEKGGVIPGDVIVEVDGMDMATATAEVVAAKCRGAIGTNVNLAVRHSKDGSKTTELTLERAKVQVNPVKTGTTTVKGKKYGILQLPSFSQETTKQVVEGLRELQKNSVDALVIDVRGNAGGYMPAGVDVAKLFLPANARIITQVDKTDRQIIDISDGIGSETKIPLYIVVDKRTASASEIMTAGLQDNGRAIVVGPSKTFGKGRIQNVQEVSGNGSGVAVTKAKYITPKGNDIHGVGISPNIKSDTCAPDNTVSDCLTSVL